MKNGRYTIGEISKMCAIPASKLRYLDAHGIIAPCFVDEETGYRYYNEETLLLISVLKYYQKCGFKLKEIEALLRRMDLDHLAPMFYRRLAELDHEILLLQMCRDSISAWHDLILEQRSATAGVVKHVWYEPTVMRVSVPHTWEGMSYETLIANIEMGNQPAYFENMGIGALYLYFPQGDRHNFSGSKIYVRPHPKEKSPAPKEALGGYGALTCYHSGSFKTAEHTYQILLDFAKKHAIPLRGDSFERSVIDCWSTKKEEELLIEIILPTTELAPGNLERHAF